MIRTLLIILFFLLGMGCLFAQSMDRHVVASGGGQTVIGGSEYSFTFGEAIIGTTASNPVLTKGFHQPDSIIILDVRLIALGAMKKGNGISVAWQLAERNDGGHFSVERSLDNLTFEEIGTLTAGDGKDLKYEFIDMATYPSDYTLFYRIRFHGPDGRVLLSEWMAVQAGGNFFLKTYPNPATDFLHVEYASPEENKDILVTLADVQGRKVWQNKNQSANPGTSWVINVSSLSQGIYTLSIAHDKGVSSRKIIISR